MQIAIRVQQDDRLHYVHLNMFINKIYFLVFTLKHYFSIREINNICIK